MHKSGHKCTTIELSVTAARGRELYTLSCLDRAMNTMKGVLVSIVLVASSASQIIHARATRTTTRPTDTGPIQIADWEWSSQGTQTAGASGAYAFSSPKWSCDELNMFLTPNAATSATSATFGDNRCLSIAQPQLYARRNLLNSP